MEPWVRRFANRIATELHLDAEREAVIAYGLIAIVQISLTLLLVVLFGLLVGALWEALVICLSVSIYRKYSGGAHAHDAEFCTVVTVVYCTLAALMARWLATHYVPALMLAAIALTYGVAFWVAYRRVPVDSPNKPIKTERKIRRMRKTSFLLLSMFVCVSVFFYVLGVHPTVGRALGISLLLGVGWQTLTLTPLGAILLNKLNDLPKFFKRR